MAFATVVFRKSSMENAAEKRERLEQLLYSLVTSQAAKRLSLIRELKDSQDIYVLVLEQFSRLASSLERRQNQARRKQLVASFGVIAGIKTLLEIHYPHLLS
jgi:hypothetical protein